LFHVGYCFSLRYKVVFSKPSMRAAESLSPPVLAESASNGDAAPIPRDAGFHLFSGTLSGWGNEDWKADSDGIGSARTPIRNRPRASMAFSQFRTLPASRSDQGRRWRLSEMVPTGPPMIGETISRKAVHQNGISLPFAVAQGAAA